MRTLSCTLASLNLVNQTRTADRYPDREAFIAFLDLEMAKLLAGTSMHRVPIGWLLHFIQAVSILRRIVRRMPIKTMIMISACP